MTNQRFTCGDHDTLVAYLYDELETERAADVARHLATCTACEEEIDALGGVRRALGEWTPPAPPLRFSALPEVVTAAQPAASRWAAVPAWAQLVAATLALAVGAAVANVQVRRDAAGWTVTTGWMSPSAPVAAAAAPAPDESWRPALAALEQSLRRDLTPTRTAAPAAADVDAASLTRVRGLIQESERRQQQELALRVNQLGRDLDMQRRADLMRIDQGIGQLEGRTGAAVARQREMLDYIVRTGLRPPQ
jgi:anti-sigma factor RsiW